MDIQNGYQNIVPQTVTSLGLENQCNDIPTYYKYHNFLKGITEFLKSILTYSLIKVLLWVAMY